MGVISLVLSIIKNAAKGWKYKSMGAEKLLALEDEEFFSAIDCICESIVYDMYATDITEEQKIVYTLTRFEAEVNNGGLCQFFVNSSSECAPFVSKALTAIGADDIKALFEDFISTNNISVDELSSFKISDVSEYEEQTKRYDFDSFDSAFYENETIHQQIIDYARKHIHQILGSNEQYPFHH